MRESAEPSRLRRTLTFAAVAVAGYLSLATSDCDDYYKTRSTSLTFDLTKDLDEDDDYLELRVRYEGDFALLVIGPQVEVSSGDGQALFVASSPDEMVPMGLGGGDTNLGGAGLNLGGDQPGTGGTTSGSGAASSSGGRIMSESPSLAGCPAEAQARFEQAKGTGALRTVVCVEGSFDRLVRLSRPPGGERSLFVEAETLVLVDECERSKKRSMGIYVVQMK